MVHCALSEPLNRCSKFSYLGEKGKPDLQGPTEVLAKTGKRSSHRGRLDIAADILNASLGEVRKTYLMYNCNLSFRQLKKYLGYLLDKGLLHSVADDKNSELSLFKITKKGRKFLEAYKGLKSLMH